MAVLALATGAVVVESELLVHAVEGVTSHTGAFPGVPRPDHHPGHRQCRRARHRGHGGPEGKIDLALQIALGSSTQVALLIAPLLVLAGLFLGQPVNLVFSLFEVVALGVSTIVVAIITLDGESHWFEGVQLLALYAMVAAAAYFL